MKVVVVIVVVDDVDGCGGGGDGRLYHVINLGLLSTPYAVFFPNRVIPSIDLSVPFWAVFNFFS